MIFVYFRLTHATEQKIHHNGRNVNSNSVSCTSMASVGIIELMPQSLMVDGLVVTSHSPA